MIEIDLSSRYFTVNEFFPIFLLIFFWGNTLVATGFFLSAFFSSSKTATGTISIHRLSVCLTVTTVFGYIYIFTTGILAQLLQVYYNTADTPGSNSFIFSS